MSTHFWRKGKALTRFFYPFCNLKFVKMNSISLKVQSFERMFSKYNEDLGGINKAMQRDWDVPSPAI